MSFENPGLKEILANWQWTGLQNSDGWEAKPSVSILLFRHTASCNALYTWADIGACLVRWVSLTTIHLWLYWCFSSFSSFSVHITGSISTAASVVAAAASVITAH